MQDAHLAESRQSLRPIRPEHQQRQRQNQQFEGGENFDYYVARKTGGTTESYGETRRQHLHLQLRCGQLRNGKRVGAHGSLHRLRNGGDFCFPGISENLQGGVDRTPTPNTHLCSAVCSQARNANDALGSSNEGLHFIFVRLKRICQVVLHMCPLFFLPIHKNTKNTKYITHISKLPQSTSCAIKNHPGVKTCRVAETRAQQLPQVMNPKNLRPSQGSKLIVEIQINYMMHRKSLEKKFTELRSPDDQNKSLKYHSTEGQKALLKPNALFSSEQGNLIRSSVFRNATPSILREYVLEGNKDHLFNQARSDLAKHELHVESLNKCIGHLQNERRSKTGHHRTYTTDLLYLDENKFDYKKNWKWKKKFSEILKSEMCTKWEKLTESKNNELTKSQCKR